MHLALEVDIQSNDRGGEGMGVICPLFRRRCHQKSPSRGNVLTNSC